MTKEQETLERIKKRLTRKADYNTGVWLAEQDIETVLNLLKEKDAEIEKKDKMIDLILDKFKEGTEYYYSEFDYMTKEDLKQYFERKAKDGRL